MVAPELGAGSQRVRNTPADGSILVYGLGGRRGRLRHNRASVAVDVAMTAPIRVRARHAKEAEALACEYGATDYPRAFELDDGLYRRPADFINRHDWSLQA